MLIKILISENLPITSYAVNLYLITNILSYFRSSDYPKTRYAKNEGGPISNLRLRNNPAMQLETLIVSISSRIKK